MKMSGVMVSTMACFVISISFVGVLYMIPEEIRKLNRGDVEHMRYRMYAATFVTFIILMVEWQFHAIVAPRTIGFEKAGFFELIGVCIDIEIMAVSIITTSLLMCVFYLGPIVTWLAYLRDRQFREVNTRGVLAKREKSIFFDEVLVAYLEQQIKNHLGTEQQQVETFRNLVFAPVVEELVFRSAIIYCLFPTYCGGMKRGFLNSRISTPYEEAFSSWYVVFACPAFFGIAHLHHFISRVAEGSKLVPALRVTLEQLTYTSIFGFIAALLFMRTGTIWAPITSHVMCNFLSLPDTSFCAPMGERYSCLYKYRHVLLVLHALGLIFFALLVLPATEGMAKSSLYWR